MARRPNRGEVPTGHLGPRPVLEEDVGHHRVDQLPHRHGGVLQRLELLGRRAHAPQRGRHPVQQVVRLVVAVVNELGIGRVQRDPGARRLPDATGQAVVVRMDVGDHDALHVSDVAPDLFHAARERAEGVVGVPPGVNQVRAAVRLEDVDQARTASELFGSGTGMLHSPSRTFSTPGNGSLAAAAPRARWACGGPGWGWGCLCSWRDVEVTTGTARGAPGAGPVPARR